MTDMRKLNSDRAIQSALIACLASIQFSSITINDICTKANVGRSTFYHHYPDKYAVLTEMVAQQANKFEHLLAARKVSPNEKAPLVTLYQALADDAATIITLLAVHEPEGDLTEEYLTGLRKLANQLWSRQQLNIPHSFVEELYASSAFTAIKWSLQHGDATSISTFMSGLANEAINKAE